MAGQLGDDIENNSCSRHRLDRDDRLWSLRSRALHGSAARNPARDDAGTAHAFAHHDFGDRLRARYRSGLSTTALTGAIMGLVFAVTQVLPAWWLGFISCLARPDDAGRWRVAPADKKSLQLNFYPIGHILVHAAIICICLICLMSCIIVLGYGGVDATMEELTAKLQPLVQKLVDSQPELASFNVESLTHLVIKTTPAIMATWYLMMFLGNLWVAGRVALTSNRLRRPWPNVAQELSLPRSLVLGLIAAAGLCFVKSWPGTIGLIATATLVAIYALQGLAVVHYLSRGLRWRGLILFSIYAVLILFIPWPLALFALLGLADVAFSLRDRKAAALLASKS
jgi:hypothetical protein